MSLLLSILIAASVRIVGAAVAAALSHTLRGSVSNFIYLWVVALAVSGLAGMLQTLDPTYLVALAITLLAYVIRRSAADD